MAFVYDNKEYRNLQEQVFKNMNDISFILQEEGVLNEFGIKVVGQEDSAIDMPSVDDYKEDNPDWAYGDAYAIGTEAPYELYVLTRANGSHPNDYWFNIGEFPMPGPQGEQGEQGEVGPQGPTGPSGQDGITPVIVMQSPSVTTLSAGSDATATVTIGGTIASPTYKFDFGIPRGADGSTPTSIAWGSITGSLTDQTDLVSALQGKANASALASYATQVYADNVASNATYQAVQAITNSAVSFASAVSFNDAVVFNSYIYKGQSNYADYPIELPSGSGTLALTTDIPSLTGYATEAWVSANFLSADTPIGGAATWGSISGTLADQTDLMSKFSEYAPLSDIPSLSGYATESWVLSQNYASQTWVNSQITSATSEFITSAALAGLASEGYVDTQIGNLSSVYAPIGNYASQDDITALSSVYASISALSSYATVSALSDYALASVVSAMDYASVGALSSATAIPVVSGTNDGSYWTSITIDEDTYDIPQGGGSGDYVVANLEEIQDEGEDNEKTVTSNVVHEQAGTITLHQTVDYTNPGEGQENSETTLTVTDNIALAAQKGKYWQVENPDYDPEDPDSPEYIDGEGTQYCNISIRADGISFARYDENESGYSSDEVDIFGLNDDFNSFKEKSESFDEDTDHPYTIESKIEHNQTDSINLQVSRSYDESQEDYYNRYASAAVYNEEEAHLEAGKDIFWQAENPDYDPEDPDSPEYNTEQGWEAYQVKVTPEGVTFEHFGNNEDGDFDESIDAFNLNPVSGTNDGTNWTALTIGSDTYSIPAGGSVSGYAELSASNSFTSRNEFASNTYFQSSVWLSSAVKLDTGASLVWTNNIAATPMYGFGYSNGITFFKSDISTDAILRMNSMGLYPQRSSMVLGGSSIPFEAAHINALYGSDNVSKPVSSIAMLSDIPSSLPANGGMASSVSGYASEVWTFTLSGGSTVSKTILVG